MPLPLPVSAAARQTIKAAFDDLDRTITPADSRDFRATTLQNVRDAALEIERQLAARGSLRNMRRLMPLFKGIEHYSKVMDVLCNGTPYLPWIWAPITLILRVASEHVEAFEQIIKGYAQLAESLVRFEVLDCAFKDNPDFQQTLAVFYADILQFHRHAYKFVRRSGWKLLFLTSWGRFQRRFDNIMEDMERHGDLIDKEANARNIAEARELRRDIRLWREQNDERVKSFEEEQAIKQYQSIMAWMNIDESDQLAILESIMAEGRNYPGTCAWILKNPKVSSWLQKRPESPILWLQGTPGSGKSVISTQLVTFMQTAKMFVMYHFCTYLYMSSTIYEQILRSLLMQLLRKDGDLVAHVYEEFVLGKKSPTVSALERLLQLLFKSVSNEPSQTEYFWIILDGLDECEPDKQARVISLMNQVTSHRSSSSGKAFCKVLISSRSSTTLSKWLRKKQKVSLSEEKHCLEGAIRLYASQRLQALEQRFRQLDIAPGELDDVELQIAKKADGMFLYARLVLDYLSTNVFYNCDEIKASVNQLPEKINDFYRKILTQVLIHLDSRSVNRIKCVLGWIAFAKRPLKRLEFLSAVTFSSGDPSVAHVAPQYILDICAPLIDERHDTTLTFIHVSMKEFLQTPSCSVTINEQEALQEHGVAAITCLLSGLEVFDTTYDEQTRYHRVVKGLHGFHVYATEYWTEYLLSRAKYASGLEASPALFSLACQIADKLNVTADLTTLKQIETQSSVQDERLAYLQQYPILYKRVRSALDARSIKQLEYELLQVPGTQILPASDGISAMLAMYQEIVKSILDQSDHPGISAQELELFKSQFRASAFTCRLKSCPRATLGFETEKFRLEHEMAHVRKFRCTFPDCHFPPFVSAQALKNHINKYHNPSPAPKSIRDIQTPALRRVRSGHDEEGDGPMHKRRKKNSPVRSAHSNAPQPEDYYQTLIKRVDSSHPPIDPPPSIRQRFIDNNFYVPRHMPFTVSHEATEKTNNLSPAAHRSSLEVPPLKRGFSPERWRGPSKNALDEALRLQNEPKERIASSLISPIPPIGQPLEMTQRDPRDILQRGALSTGNKLRRLPSLRDFIATSEPEQPSIEQETKYHSPTFEEVEGRYADMQKSLNYLEPFASTGYAMLNRIKQSPRQSAADIPVLQAQEINASSIQLQSLMFGDGTLQSSGNAGSGFEDEDLVDDLNSLHDPLMEESNRDKEQPMSPHFIDVLDEQLSFQQKQATNATKRSQDGLYEILADSMEVPPNVRICYLLPETCETWEHLWRLQSKFRWIQEQMEFLRRLQKWQFEMILQKECALQLGQGKTPVFRASDTEISRARRRVHRHGGTDYEIVQAIIQTKHIVWGQMEQEFHTKPGAEIEDEEVVATYWLGALKE